MTMKGMIHTSTLKSTKQKFTLAYDNGTAVFTAGKTLTGATSHATAIIISTGSIASGSLSLHTITGTFQNNEAISDNGTIPGAALVDGIVAEALDEYGQPTTTTVNTAAMPCRFFSSADWVMVAGQALYGETTLKVMFDGAYPVIEGDTITSTETGYASTFGINSVTPAYARGPAVHHYTCTLARTS